MEPNEGANIVPPKSHDRNKTDSPMSTHAIDTQGESLSPTLANFQKIPIVLLENQSLNQVESTRW